jgi:cell division protein FtsL
VHLPTEAAAVHVSRPLAGKAGDQARNGRDPRRDIFQHALAERQATRMAKRGVELRGRTLLALVLAAFVCVALSIVWRRTIGIGQSERLAALDAKRSELEGERARVESDIRDASSRQRLGVVAESLLGMHVPSDRQVVILPRTRRRESP